MKSEVLDAILKELKAQRVPDSLWSTEEVGLYFGVSSKTACGIVALSTFPDPVAAPKVGRRWLPHEVRTWAAQHRQRRHAEPEPGPDSDLGGDQS